MQVIQADALGMCFGVKDALAMADSVVNPASVSINGPIVHHPLVVERLGRAGFSIGVARSTVMITAHGVSNRERAALTAAGKQLLDTTCPLVVRAHRAALELAREGRHVLVIGRPGHVEVRGLVGDLTSYDVVARPADVRAYPHRRLGIVCQTTVPTREVEPIRAAIAAHNPAAQIRFVDTVCGPTKDRQKALARLLDQVDAMVVVGGRHSNNTGKLLRLCEARGLPAVQVEGPHELDPAWLTGYRTVGLTAGTSTPDETIAEVRAKLEQL